jgi:hypothetical protein
MSARLAEAWRCGACLAEAWRRWAANSKNAASLHIRVWPWVAKSISDTSVATISVSYMFV